MRVLLRVPRDVQDAGRMRPLSCGAVYDVPEVLAQQWIETGMADPVVDVAAMTGAPRVKATRHRRRA